MNAMDQLDYAEEEAREVWIKAKLRFLEFSKGKPPGPEVLELSKQELIAWTRYRKTQGYPVFNQEYA